MNHSNTTLCAIPNFEFGIFLQFFLWNSKYFYYIFKQFRPWLEGSWAMIWVWSVWKHDIDSLQQATRLKELKMVIHISGSFTYL